MRHGYSKIKFKSGQDANQMLLRKLAVNFFMRGKLKTTLKKAKVLKTLLERLIEKMKVKNEANKNYLLKVLGDRKLVERSFSDFGMSFVNIKGGYVRIIKSGVRDSDGSEMALVQWAKDQSPVKKKVNKT
jgi:large subunit ribosomal protein L17